MNRQAPLALRQGEAMITDYDDDAPAIASR